MLPEGAGQRRAKGDLRRRKSPSVGGAGAAAADMKAHFLILEGEMQEL